MAYPTIYPKRILLVGKAINQEYIAINGSIIPGYLIELDALSKVAPHSASGAEAERLFAAEDALQGNGIEDTYAIGTPVSCFIAERGAVVYAWLAASQSVTPASFLMSNGDGTLTPVTGSGKILCKSLDTLSSASDAVATRVRVRIV